MRRESGPLWIQDQITATLQLTLKLLYTTLTVKTDFKLVEQ